MPRFRKGTTDHDSDGRMGGSLKGDNTMAKSAATKAKEAKAAEPVPAVMAGGAVADNAAEERGSPPADFADALPDVHGDPEEGKAKSAKKAPKLSDSERIDAIVELLEANGMSLPKKLR